MPRRDRFLFAISASLLIMLGACGPAPSLKSLDEAHQKFIKLCREEYKMEALLSPAKKTLWIYIPTDGPILDIKASGTKLPESNASDVQFNLNHLLVEHKEGDFLVNYDIAEEIVYPKSPGYVSQFTEAFTLKYQGIFQAIQRTYVDLDVLPADRERLNIPGFIAIVFADIHRGIELKLILNLEDLKKELVQAIPAEEANLRRSTEISGNKNIIGDKEGGYLEIKEITWEEFLSKQMANRINFAYTQSTKEIQQNPHELLAEMAAMTIKAYDFTKYGNVQLIDLRRNERKTIDKASIDKYDIRKTTVQSIEIIKGSEEKDGVTTGY